VPLRLTNQPLPTNTIELMLPSGTTLRFPTDTTPELIVAIIRGLETTSC
jgi:hypothetical protein